VQRVGSRRYSFRCTSVRSRRLRFAEILVREPLWRDGFQVLTRRSCLFSPGVLTQLSICFGILLAQSISSQSALFPLKAVRKAGTDFLRGSPSFRSSDGQMATDLARLSRDRSCSGEFDSADTANQCRSDLACPPSLLQIATSRFMTESSPSKGEESRVFDVSSDEERAPLALDEDNSGMGSNTSLDTANSLYPLLRCRRAQGRVSYSGSRGDVFNVVGRGLSLAGSHRQECFVDIGTVTVIPAVKVPRRSLSLPFSLRSSLRSPLAASFSGINTVMYYSVGYVQFPLIPRVVISLSLVAVEFFRRSTRQTQRWSLSS
jgi:hypothetical protein